MGMRYSASFSAVAVSAAQDLFELLAPADACIAIHSIRLGQSSDFGDAQAEGLEVTLKRATGSYTSGSGGTSPSKNALESGFSAAGATVEANNTTQAAVGTGTLTKFMHDTFNIQIGWLYQPVPEERIILSPSQALILSLDSAPADAITMSGTIVWEEIGG